MSDSGNGDVPPGRAGDGEADGQGDRPDRKERARGAQWPLTLFPGVCSGVIATVTMKYVYAYAWLRALVTAVVALLVLIVLGRLAAWALGKATKVWPPGGLLKRVVTVLCGGAVGASAMALILLADAGVQRALERTGACGQPLELRVLTTPETLEALRSAAAEFEVGSQDGGCRQYSVTVVPEVGPLPLYDGFRLLWRRSAHADARHADGERLLGPQPDIWIPASTAEYDFIPKGAAQVASAAQTGGRTAGSDGGGDPAFRPRGSLGSSPLVLALFPDAHNSVVDPFAPPLTRSTAELLKRVDEADVPLHAIARPVPETSSAALAVTPALYDALRGADDENEQFAESADLVAPDAVSLLCQFRERAAKQDSEPPDDIAVAVPEQVLHDYDMGRPLGDRCGAVDPDAAQYAKWRLHPYYAADLPTLDYPFIQVKWRGQDTEERDAAVGEFRGWLDDHPLALQGFRDERGVMPPATEGDTGHFYLTRLQSAVGHRVMPSRVDLTKPKGVQETLDRIGAARPKISVSLMLDVSGSMGSAAQARGGPRLSRGSAFLRSLVSQLQSNDRAGLQVSSSTSSPSDMETFGNVPQDVASPDQKNAITSRVEAVASAGADRPLIDAIAAAELGLGRPSLILVTDGQIPETNPRLGSRTEWLSGEFREEHPDLRLKVVLTGPTGCGSSPVDEIVDALGDNAECVALTGAPEAEQAAELLSELR